jgi:hypothetical protein
MGSDGLQVSRGAGEDAAHSSLCNRYPHAAWVSRRDCRR